MTGGSDDWLGESGEAGLLSAIVETSADAIIGQRLDGRVMSWNQGAQAHYGWSSEEMLGKSISRIVPEALQAELAFIIERVAQGETVRNLQTRRQHRDGHVIDVSSTVSPIRDGEGNIVGISTIERDVTRRRRLDATVDAQRRMLEALTRTGSLSDGLGQMLGVIEKLTDEGIQPVAMVLDSERNRLVPRASALASELTAALEAGIPLSPDGHPSGAAAFSRQAVSVSDLSKAEAWGGMRDKILESGYQACCSTPMLSPDGEIYGTLDLYSESPGDPRADDLEVISSLSGSAAMVIERFETVRDLRTGRRVLAALNDISASFARDLDVERIVKVATERGTKLVGAQVGAFFEGRTVGDEVTMHLMAISGKLASRFKDIAEPRNTLLFHHTLTNKGTVRLFDVHRDPRFGKMAPHEGYPPGHPNFRSYLAAPVASATGEVFGGIFFGHAKAGWFTHWHEEIVRGIAAHAGMAIDNARVYAREKEQAQALRIADQRKNEFLALLGHELRNPLGAVTNSLALVQESCPETEDTRKALSILWRQTRHMGRLVDDLLDVSRITRGKIELQRATIDLREILQDAASDAKPLFDEGSQRLELSLGDVPAWVDGDRVRIQQVVGNLLHNAAKFSPRDGTVTLSLEIEDEAARIRVRDHGRGLRPDELGRIFEHFVQAGDRTPSGGGLGLGLSLAKALVEMHDGQIYAESPGYGKGATFVVALPITEAPPTGEVPRRPATRATAARAGAARAVRIVIAEDQADAAGALAMLLTRWGHEVHHARDGHAALRLIQEIRPDMALLDIGMPGMTGWEVAQAVRKDPDVSGTRLFAMSGLGQPGDAKRSKAAGVERHLVKPVDPGELQVLIGEVAADREAGRDASDPAE